MFDVAAIAVLTWLLIVHCMLRVSYARRRRELNTMYGMSADVEAPAEALADAEADILQLSAQIDVNSTHTNYAIGINVLCIGPLALLVILNYTYGILAAGWMSVLLLPVPIYMLLWHIHGEISWVIGREPHVIHRLAASIRRPIIAASTALLAVVLSIIIMLAKNIAPLNAQPIDVVDAGVGLNIGVFTVISGLIVIIAGGIALRLLYIDKEYGGRIDIIDRDIAEVINRSSQTSRQGAQTDGKYDADAPSMDNKSLSTFRMRLTEVGGKREANGRGILVDVICTTLICIVGFATALGYSPGLLVSAVVSFTCFLCVVVPLHHHIRNALNQSH